MAWRRTAADGRAARAIRSRTDSLAIGSDSVDAVLLPHTLEYEPDPHEILREVGRILVRRRPSDRVRLPAVVELGRARICSHATVSRRASTA